jgi:hypothetical protein
VLVGFQIGVDILGDKGVGLVDRIGFRHQK